MKNIEDKLAIYELAYKFADAANRHDDEMFQTLWADDGAKWIIGAPISKEFNGKEQMSDSFSKMLGLWEFFVQMVTGGVVRIMGDKAYARFYVQEIANSKAGTGNHNLSMYEDELVKQNGEWYFRQRQYHTIFQSMERQIGEVIGVPNIPRWP